MPGQPQFIMGHPGSAMGVPQHQQFMGQPGMMNMGLMPNAQTNLTYGMMGNQNAQGMMGVSQPAFYGMPMQPSLGIRQ